MNIIKTIKEIRVWSDRIRKNSPDKKIGLIPTMGFLHEGHLSLIREMKSEADYIVVSIFVNPIQFNNPDDLLKYPRDMERDILLLSNEGIDVLFSPDSDEVYKKGYPEIFMDYPNLTNKLCGKYRPGHFSGVLTIVHNLFQWIQPHFAIFGLKDFQQYLLIKKMCDDLQMNVAIMPGNLVREHDGLAMSSRNVRLSPAERQKALIISHTLFQVRELFRSGNINTEYLQNYVKDKLGELSPEYASIYNPHTLEELTPEEIPFGSLVAVAAVVGNVRLIDNMFLSQEEEA